MIRVDRAPEPCPPAFDFDGEVRQPGHRAIRELSGDSTGLPARRGRPRQNAGAWPTAEAVPSEALPPHWRRALPTLLRVYGRTCAWLGMRIPEATGLATVDHFVPRRANPWGSYEWDNLRLSSFRVNSLKQDAVGLLDPFEVEDGWFALDLATFCVEPAEHLEDSLRLQVQHTIDAVHLNDPVFCGAREEHFNAYHGLPGPDDVDGDRPPPMALQRLRWESPFVARALERQGRLRVEDRRPL